MKLKQCHSNNLDKNSLDFSKLISFIAYRFPPTTICNHDDYIQIGHIAALKAIKSYKENSGTKLSSFVGICVFRAIMITYLKNKNNVSVSEQSAGLQNKAKLMQKMGASIDEICERLNISRKKLNSFKVLLKNKQSHLNILIDNNISYTNDSIIDHNLNINNTDKKILLMRMEGYTLREISSEFKKSTEWVRNRIKSIGFNYLKSEELNECT